MIEKEKHRVDETAHMKRTDKEDQTIADRKKPDAKVNATDMNAKTTNMLIRTIITGPTIRNAGSGMTATRNKNASALTTTGTGTTRRNITEKNNLDPEEIASRTATRTAPKSSTVSRAVHGCGITNLREKHPSETS